MSLYCVWDAQTEEISLKLPPGFRSKIVAKNLGPARHISVRSNGDIYVRLRKMLHGGAIVALRDKDKDGDYETKRYFEKESGTGIKIFQNALYYSTSTNVFRRKFKNPKELIPSGKKEMIIGGFPNQRGHGAKPLAFDGQGHLYVGVGAPSNGCQKSSRSRESPGLNPCPLLKRHGGVWQFSDSKTNQDQMKTGKHYARGIRSIVAMAYNPFGKSLFLVQHGRDQLYSLWPKIYSLKKNALLPAEEMLLIPEGFVGGWPYTYYDGLKMKRMIAPEYGGNGKKEAAQGKYPEPAFAFPAHWAPNDLLFYTGSQFSKRYHGGAFIAFHGSWNRAPFEQKGYHVAFLPMKGNQVLGKNEKFASGFTGQKKIASPGEAKHRPMGLSIGPKGSLFIADSVKGYIWRVTYPSKK